MSCFFKQTIGRQFHTVASIFAPPPPQQPSSCSPPPTLSHDSDDTSGEASPFSFEGVKKAVTEFSKLASNLIQSNKEDFEEDPGITDDIVQFVGMLSNHPNLWIDFPLSLKDKDINISDVQMEHIIAIEEIVPSLSFLMHSVDMSEEHFWIIYFVLLLPQLNEDDYQLLSTPEIVVLHKEVVEKLKNRKNTEDTSSKKGTERSTNTFQETNTSGETSNATYRRKNRNHEDDDVCISDLDYDTSSGVRQTQSSMPSSMNEFSDWFCLSKTLQANRLKMIPLV